MIIHDVKQGTTQWLELRAGRPTASSMDKIITAGGKPSSQAERYMFTLLAERLLGRPLVEHVSFWQMRGQELEREAVQFYHFQRDIETEPVGFITSDDGRWGASPDRLVGDDGLLEIKCPSEWVHVGYLLNSGKAYQEHIVQCQAQLWVTGRKWVDLLSYEPELPPALHRVERDEEFISKLASAVTTFSYHLEAMAQDLAKRGWMKPIREPQLSEQERMVRVLRESLIAIKQ